MEFVIRAQSTGCDPHYWAADTHWPQRPDIATRFGSLTVARKVLDDMLDNARHPALTTLVQATGLPRVQLQIYAIDQDGVLGWRYDQHVTYYGNT